MIFHSVDRLVPPFHSVSEVGLVIPREGRANVHNTDYKLLFFLEANCLMAIDDAREFAVEKGDICVMPGAGLQSYHASGSGLTSRVHALKIMFRLPLVSRGTEAARVAATSGDPEQNLGSFVRHHFREVRMLKTVQTAAMQEIMREIRTEAERQLPGIRHRVSALCADLVVQVARGLYAAPAQASVAGSGYGAIVNQIKEFLLRNLNRELTLGEIAWHVKKSDEHVARVFRKVTGQTVFDYLRTVRLESAKTMLIDSDKTLTEIAARTGFSSLSLFSRNFRQYVGRNPSSYREARAMSAQWHTADGPGVRGAGRSISGKQYQRKP